MSRVAVARIPLDRGDTASDVTGEVVGMAQPVGGTNHLNIEIGGREGGRMRCVCVCMCVCVCVCVCV